MTLPALTDAVLATSTGSSTGLSWQTTVAVIGAIVLIALVWLFMNRKTSD